MSDTKTYTIAELQSLDNAALDALAAELRGWKFSASGILQNEIGDEVKQCGWVVFKPGAASEAYPYFWTPTTNYNQSTLLLDWFVEKHHKANHLILRARLLSNVRLEWVAESSMELQRVESPGSNARSQIVAFCAAMLAMVGRLNSENRKGY